MDNDAELAKLVNVLMVLGIVGMALVLWMSW
jgi:hypothetical protein